MDVPLLREHISIDHVIVNKAFMRINQVVALYTVEDKIVFVDANRYFSGHAPFWNSYYGLTNEDVGFEEMPSGGRDMFLSKEVDCTNMQKYMLQMGPKYMNIMYDIKSFKLSDDVSTLVNVAWNRLFRKVAIFKIFLTCVLLGGLYTPVSIKPLVAPCCAPFHLLFMLASANMFRKNQKHSWLFKIDLAIAVPITMTILESVAIEWIPDVLELSSYAYTVLYLVSLQQLMQMMQVPVIGYIDNVFLSSMKLVLPIIFSVVLGMVFIDVLNIKQTEANNVVDKFLLMYDILSRITFDFRRVDMRSPYNDYFIVVMIVFIIIVKAMCVSVFFMVRDTVSSVQRAMELQQNDDIKSYRLQFISSIWATYDWCVWRIFSGKRALVLSKT